MSRMNEINMLDNHIENATAFAVVACLLLSPSIHSFSPFTNEPHKALITLLTLSPLGPPFKILS